MRRVQRHTTGSVRFDKRRGTWGYLWYEAGKRRSKVIGTKREFPTKAAAWKEVERLDIGKAQASKGGHALTFAELVMHYREEKMPKRIDTRRSYEVWLRNYILPR